MKRTIAAAVLSTLLALTFPAYACTTMPGFEPINSARLWKSWNSFERAVYLSGFADGSQLVVYTYEPIDERSQTAKAAALRYDFSQIREVMTSLYSDPANAYIALGAMVFIARDKLDGKNAELLLTEARQNDCEYRSTFEKSP
jgi:hypothetical protein